MRRRFLKTKGARRAALVLVGALPAAALLVLLLLWEGEPDELLGHLQAAVASLLSRFGRPAAFALLYIEESGVPLPVPGDVYVLYVGHRAAGERLVWIVSWLGLIFCVVLGASNLYLISRRWGRRLAAAKLGQMLHINEERLAQGERWFARWGVWAIIFGRHLPGLRIPITVAAGVLRVRYRVFVASVAVSTAIWAGFFMLIGSLFGGELQTALRLHRGRLLVGVILVLLVGGAIFVARHRFFRLLRRADAPARNDS